MIVSIIIAALLVVPFGVLMGLEGPLINAVLLQKLKVAPRRWVSAAVSAGLSLLLIAFTACMLNGVALNVPNALAEATSFMITSAAFAWRWAFWFTDMVNQPDRGDEPEGK